MDNSGTLAILVVGLVLGCSNDETTGGPPPQGGAGGVAGQGGAGASGADGGAGGSASLCLMGGMAVSSGDEGTCTDPFVIDMSGLPLGTVISHATGEFAPDAGGFNGTCMDQWAGTGRDLVYDVEVPDTATTLEVSVDAAAGADVKIGIVSDNTCADDMNVCVNDASAGACEIVSATIGTDTMDERTFVVITQDEVATTPLLVRMRASDASGGAGGAGGAGGSGG